MGLKSGNLRGWNSSFEDDICDRTTSGDTRRFRRKLKAPHAMVESKREADRAARRALAGRAPPNMGPAWLETENSQDSENCHYRQFVSDAARNH